MGRPIFIWKLAELERVRTIRTNGVRALKQEADDYRIWLTRTGYVIVEERRDGQWIEVENYLAKLTDS